MTTPIFPLASSLDWLIAARFIDRIGKGIRGAPRDALVADIAPPELRGASFGLRQSLDTIGAFLGPLLATALMWLTTDHFRTVFWVAVIPAFLSVGVILFAIKEPKWPKTLRKVRMPLHRDELRRLGSAYWWLVAIAAVFTLARFSEAFHPIGILSNRMDRVSILIVGMVLLADLILVSGQPMASGLKFHGIRASMSAAGQP